LNFHLLSIFYFEKKSTHDCKFVIEASPLYGFVVFWYASFIFSMSYNERNGGRVDKEIIIKIIFNENREINNLLEFILKK
jgi:hypothetical protein